jgi:hypothetical protein
MNCRCCGSTDVSVQATLTYTERRCKSCGFTHSRANNDEAQVTIQALRHAERNIRDVNKRMPGKNESRVEWMRQEKQAHDIFFELYHELIDHVGLRDARKLYEDMIAEERLGEGVVIDGA